MYWHVKKYCINTCIEVLVFSTYDLMMCADLFSLWKQRQVPKVQETILLKQVPRVEARFVHGENCKLRQPAWTQGCPYIRNSACLIFADCGMPMISDRSQKISKSHEWGMPRWRILMLFLEQTLKTLSQRRCWQPILAKEWEHHSRICKSKMWLYVGLILPTHTHRTNICKPAQVFHDSLGDRSILSSWPLYDSTPSNSVVENCVPSLYSQHCTALDMAFNSLEHWSPMPRCAIALVLISFLQWTRQNAVERSIFPTWNKTNETEVWQWDVSPARCFICPTIAKSRQSRQPVKSTRCAGGLINKLRKGPQVSWIRCEVFCSPKNHV